MNPWSCRGRIVAEADLRRNCMLSSAAKGQTEVKELNGKNCMTSMLPGAADVINAPAIDDRCLRP